MPKARLPPRPYQLPESIRGFSNVSRLTREELHVLSELSAAWDSAVAKAIKKKQAELQFDAPDLLRSFPRYALDAFTFISKFSRSTKSADYGTSLMEYMAGKYPQTHAQVCDVAREQLGLTSKAPPVPKELQKTPEERKPQDDDGLSELYSHPETFLPVVSRAPPARGHAQDAGGQGEKPWFIRPSQGVIVKKNKQFPRVPKERPVRLPTPERYSKHYQSNPLVDNLRFYFNIIQPEGLRPKGIAKFVRGNSAHWGAARFVNENGLDLANPEHVLKLEDFVVRTYGQGALGKTRGLRKKTMTLGDLRKKPLIKPNRFDVEYTPSLSRLLRAGGRVSSTGASTAPKEKPCEKPPVYLTIDDLRQRARVRVEPFDVTFTPPIRALLRQSAKAARSNPLPTPRVGRQSKQRPPAGKLGRKPNAMLNAFHFITRTSSPGSYAYLKSKMESDPAHKAAEKSILRVIDDNRLIATLPEHAEKLRLLLGLKENSKRKR